MTNRQIRYRRSSTVLWRRCSQNVLLLPRGTERPLSLSGSGVDLWQLLEETQTLQTTSNLLAKRFDTDVREVTPSVVEVLDQLVKVRAVELTVS